MVQNMYSLEAVHMLLVILLLSLLVFVWLIVLRFKTNYYKIIQVLYVVLICSLSEVLRK